MLQGEDDTVPTSAPSPGPTPTPSPSPVPTTEPTVKPTIHPTPKTSVIPSAIPTRQPAVPVRVKVIGITLEFVRIEKLDKEEIEKFQEVTKDWYEGFFQEQSGRRNLQETFAAAADVRNMTTNITVTGQDFLASDAAKGRPHNVDTIKYDQELEYVAYEDALQPEEYIRMPFLDPEKNKEYGDMLSASIPAFVFVETPISPPILSEPSSGGDLSTGAIIGIAVGAAAACIAAVLGATTWRKAIGKRTRESNVESVADTGTVGPSETSRTAEMDAQQAATPSGEGPIPTPMPAGGETYRPTYKDCGRTVVGEPVQLAYAEAIAVEMNNDDDDNH